MVYYCYTTESGKPMEITITKDALVENLKEYFLKELERTLESSDLSQEERDANVTLAKRKIASDADGIANLVFTVSAAKSE
jgi:hypothetical protein